MIDDPIVAEVRKVREQMFKECGHDLHKLVQFLRHRRKKSRCKGASRTTGSLMSRVTGSSKRR